jgi:predicted transcriptional regulator
VVVPGDINPELLRSGSVYSFVSGTGHAKDIVPWRKTAARRRIRADFRPVLPDCPLSGTLRGMEVHFTPEQQAQLAQIANQAGTAPERLVTNVVARYLNEEARFLAAVQKGLAAADRGEFIEEEEMDARLEAMFKT